ncbi:MAG: Sapep family Mn(2+)-dependent dipeptidase [Coriobacteriia bacterium]|nr:Sapep family Mn(2+)-dependent dipeptidase [Coriobacteriia bacterium]
MLDEQIQQYLKDNTTTIVEDIRSLVKIPSITGTKEAVEAMEEALKLSRKFGFKTKNHKNIIGIADLPGKTDKQLGFIGHMDVVPPGPGWNLDPFDVTYTDGYLVGRGVLDDKGANVILLHAINFLLKSGYEFNYSLRYLFGTDEETNTSDIETYLEDFEEPDIVISPDGDFPICYGEKGLYRCNVISKKINNKQIIELSAGDYDNAVAGSAYALVKKDRIYNRQNFKLAHALNIEVLDNTVKITAKGRSAHAAEPYDGIDSIAVLVKFLIDQNIGSDEEQQFLSFVSKIAGKPEGSEIGIQAQDDDLGELTIVPTKLDYTNNIFTQVLDCRYPTTITSEFIKSQIEKHSPNGSQVEETGKFEPYLINPNSKLIQKLKEAYEDAMGQPAKLFTIGGYTYARYFKQAVSFGPYMEWAPRPAWVGTLHGPDEGISAKCLQDTFKIYVYMLKYINEANLD